MRDVALRAGVSVMTVSRVVNENARVDDATRARVQAAIRMLGYRPNEAASALRRTGARTATIGLVVDDVANPFCSAVQRGVERECRAREHLLFAASSGRDRGEERSLIAAFLGRRVDGLVVMGADCDYHYLAAELRRGVRVVFADRRPVGLDADFVASDNTEAARTGTAHMTARGHRRVALLGNDPRISTTLDRRLGYREALLAAGLTPDPALEALGLADAQAAESALGRMLDGPARPTAVFASQNLVLIGALRALHARDLQHQVALVGLDDVALAEVVAPAVTVVCQNPDAIGGQAASLLLGRISGDTGPARTVVVPTHLIERGSGEIPAL